MSSVVGVKMEKSHRNPSRHRIEEHDMLNWMKANRKRMNAGEESISMISLVFSV